MNAYKYTEDLINYLANHPRLRSEVDNFKKQLENRLRLNIKGEELPEEIILQIDLIANKIKLLLFQ